jgi:hypothetical protein
VNPQGLTGEVRAARLGRACVVTVAGVAVVALLVTLSMLLVRPAPSYDPWSWLLWGRELAHGALDTREGPAFKPLPVGLTALLAPAGSLAPVLWVALVRVAAVAALVLSFSLGRRLAGGSWVAGLLAAAGVTLCGAFLGTAAAGAETPLVLALALGAAEAWRRERYGLVIACVLGCALLRVEAWSFVALAGVLLWRRAPQLRPALLGAAAVVPLTWIVPELIGSGEPFRSAGRARMPNPGQPALADVPALAALGEALRLPLWPLWAGVAILAVDARRTRHRVPLQPAAAGVAWILIVAVMAQLGFSGEPRYSLAGAALVAISGAVGLAGGAYARDRRWLLGLAVALVAVAAVPRLADLADMREHQAYQWALAADLEDGIRASGGREAVLGCGRPYVGPLRGPLMAYKLDVRKRVVEPDERPRAPGVVFRSALNEGDPAQPDIPAEFEPIVRNDHWEIARRCS